MAMAFVAAPALKVDGVAPAAAPQRAAPSVPPAAAPSGGATPLLVPGALLSVCAVAARAGKKQTRRRQGAVCVRAETATVEPPAVEAAAEPLAAVVDAAPAAASSDAGEGEAPMERPLAIPFLPEPEYRKYVANVPGDAGFDPLGLAGASPETFKDMLEAETKHGRVAMLAFVGIVAPELGHSKIAAELGLDDLLVDGCVPTLQNGGLVEPEVAIGTGVAFGIFAAAELEQPRISGVPGYFGFDPLNLGGVEFSNFAKSLLKSEAPWVAVAEAKHGRIAMLAVTYIVLAEAFTGVPSIAAI